MIFDTNTDCKTYHDNINNDDILKNTIAITVFKYKDNEIRIPLKQMPSDYDIYIL